MGGRALCPHAAPLLAPPLCGLAAAKRYPLWAGRGQLSLLAAMNGMPCASLALCPPQVTHPPSPQTTPTHWQKQTLEHN
ncbi:hypothetical protein BHM03_00003952 [Ensete ventricosum]|nr:hypothetical protein BHM03_00003952 [Ensete ventricosum]